VIIVTGASRGLGLSIANSLCEEGHEVIGVARNPPKVPFSFQYEQGDVTSYESLKAISRKLKDKDAEVDGIVCAAGIASMNLALMTPPKVVRDVIDINLIGTIFTNQIFSKHMLRNGGAIVNFSTIAVPLALAGESVYVSSKAGIEAFSRTFARELSYNNVRVNCIAPGPIKTDLLRGVSDKQIEKIVDRQIIKRIFEPKDIVDLTLILLSREFSSVTGEVLHVGGV
jgi:3-oxoacyl-[acyl-carrier protein] reductase